ncbi:MAG: JDVT-CTERM system glutamic-type intramembrane protease MrtJ [Caldimonas sp.]
MPTFGLLALLLVGAPLLEEVVFRGGLQEQLLGRLSPAAANASTAVAFALAHGVTRSSWWLASAVLLPACALGCLYERERRLAPCVLAHAAMNLLWIGVSSASATGVGTLQGGAS